MPSTFSEKNFHHHCDQLAKTHVYFQSVLDNYGYPPFWSRTASFETLIHIILEQQVSLASAKAALVKLQEKIFEITPANLLSLSDEEMRACYFSRQKMKYARCLAEAIMSGELKLQEMSGHEDAEIRQSLKKIKGIGDWTVDIYLLFALHHSDIFPLGDLAMVNAMKDLLQLEKNTLPAALLDVAASWRPYRSLGTMMLWHYYLSKKTSKKNL
jgi:DNA-3-methyladenine glycosylase II